MVLPVLALHTRYSSIWIGTSLNRISAEELYSSICLCSARQLWSQGSMLMCHCCFSLSIMLFLRKVGSCFF
ncbi:unnamed protein product [Urochloa humidicola]